jgi:AraC-like DNA-binding protein
MRYREYAASPLLASIVQCVWTLEGHAGECADLQPILPDGRPEIILHLGDPFDRIERTGARARQATALFAGQLVGPLTLQPTGSVAVVGVRLQPHGAAALFDQPQSDLVGSTIGVGDLSPRLAHVLNGVRDRASSVHDAAHIVQRCLETCVDDSRLDRRVAVTVGVIRDARGLVTVDDLARRVGLTARHLERTFKQTVGVSPKRLARITRFQRALRLLERSHSPQRGTHTAAECGYADQAHFIRDFREMAGCPPGAHLLRQAELNGFFVSS